MTDRLPDDYFAAMYEESPDPWRFADRWYEQRKYAITMALLPRHRYRHAFEPGCSVGVLTELLAQRCDHVTSTDIAEVALAGSRSRLQRAGCLDRVTLHRKSFDEPWPVSPGSVDLVVISEVAYYLCAAALRRVLDRECAQLAPGATLIASHWRPPVADYPLTGDAADAAIAATDGLHRAGGYSDDDVVISLFTKGAVPSVAAEGGVPGASVRPG